MNIFFGAGKLGKRYYTFARECGIVVDRFMDNDPALWYKQIEGLEVIPPDRLKDFTEDIIIWITCKNWRPIWCQLRELGVRGHQIRRCDSGISILAALMELPAFRPPLKKRDDPELLPRGVLFVLDWGLRLGGVESWSLNTAEELRKLNWNACLLLNRETQADMEQHEDEHMVKAVCPGNSTEWETLSRITDSMFPYRNIICNFRGNNLMAASLIKQRFPTRYRVIAVLHCDHEAYYQGYMDAEPYLDKCLIISGKIGDEMVKRGFPKEKLIYLPFKTPCHDVFSHCYSRQDEPLRIGCAGRIEVDQKRVDLLILVAKKLKERGIDFRMEIAGTGPYEEELYQQIQAAGLEDKVRCLGMLSNTGPFWSRQDVMITCSEYEGHSISQCEGMAAGAVPVITDTSGARDDVEDGINGFVVNVGDIDQMVDRICYLNSHREQLSILGERAYKTIVKRNNSFDFQKLWENILLK